MIETFWWVLMSRGHDEQVLLSVAFQSPNDQVFHRRLVFFFSKPNISNLQPRVYLCSNCEPFHCYSNSNFENLGLFLSSSDISIIGLESKSEVLIYETAFQVRSWPWQPFRMPYIVSITHVYSLSLALSTKVFE